MLLPTRRAFLIALVPPAVILLGGGSPGAITTAWSLLGTLAVAWVLDAWNATFTAGLSFERRVPRQLYIDQPHEIEWIVDNRGHRPVTIELRDLPPEGAALSFPIAKDRHPRQFAETVAARSRVRLQYTLTPRVRGDSAFGDMFYRVRGRLGLAWKQRRLPAAQPVRCLPHLANWTAAELAARAALVRQSGSHRYRWRGTGTVFESLREYNPQDDIRWVDWKATARAHRPISRNFEAERHQQLVLIVDGSRMMSTYCGHRTKFDAVLEAAVLAARSAADQGDAVGLLVFSDRPEVYLHPRRERMQVGRIMDALYDRHPRLVEPDFETALTLAAQRNRRRSLVILFTDVTVIESSRRMSIYVRTLIPRHLPLVVTISDDAVERLETTLPRDASELYQVGVANELQQQRDELLQMLRSGGAAVLDSPADQIATRTIETYLDLKRRLRL